MRYLLIFLILFIFTTAATAIKCYHCDSMSDKLCHYAPEHAFSHDCEDAEMPEYLEKYGLHMAATGCMTKITQGVDNDPLFFRRTCYFGDLERTEGICNIPDTTLPYKDILDCNVCSEDLCNTNNTDQTQRLNLLFAFILGILALFLR